MSKGEVCSGMASSSARYSRLYVKERTSDWVKKSGLKNLGSQIVESVECPVREFGFSIVFTGQSRHLYDFTFTC